MLRDHGRDCRKDGLIFFVQLNDDRLIRQSVYYAGGASEMLRPVSDNPLRPSSESRDRITSVGKHCLPLQPRKEERWQSRVRNR